MVQCAARPTLFSKSITPSTRREYVDWKYDNCCLWCLLRRRRQETATGELRIDLSRRESRVRLRSTGTSMRMVGSVIPKVESDTSYMAIWFMDDGCKSRSAVYLNTSNSTLTARCVAGRMLASSGAIMRSVTRTGHLRTECECRERGLRGAVELIEPYSVAGVEIQTSASDPVTTETNVRWCSRLNKSIHEHHNTPTPRLWSGRVKI